ncbi:MAG: ABC transporter ATP-binding protein [Bacillota bacterium]|nr:ABC transporter ATP-binding protein [Bacillota bacterium]
MIELRNVSYSYDNSFNALKDITLNIEPGEAVAFVGVNGSGKSTLMKIINGLVFPAGGTFSFDGIEITEKRLMDTSFAKAFHKRVGFVFQNSEAQLFCTTVYDEIAFGPRQMGMAEEEVKSRVEDILRLLHIEELAKRQPYHLSGGEKKKIAIASVLVLNPEVIVLDEPMNGLDPKTKRFLRELMIALNKAGKTILCSTHDFDYVQGIFKRAVVFSKEHTVIRDGSYEEIITDREFLIENNII